MSGGMVIFVFIVGGGLWLAFYKPWTFWLCVFPMALLVIIAFIKWLKK